MCLYFVVPDHGTPVTPLSTPKGLTGKGCKGGKGKGVKGKKNVSGGMYTKFDVKLWL